MIAYLSVRLYPINLKTTEPIGPHFFWDLTGPKGRFMEGKTNRGFFIIHKKVNKSASLVCYSLIIKEGKMPQMEQQ